MSYENRRDLDAALYRDTGLPPGVRQSDIDGPGRRRRRSVAGVKDIDDIDVIERRGREDDEGEAIVGERFDGLS